MEHLKIIRQKILLCLLLNLSLFFPCIKAMIFACSDYDYFTRHIIPTLGKKSLVVWDIDETLIRYDKLFDVYYRNDFANFFIEQNLDEETFSRIFLATGAKLVDNDVLEVIRLLRIKKVKMIALTGHSTGSQGVIENLAAFCYQKLKDNGINFSKSFTKYNNTIFWPLDAKIPSLFYNGIIFTNGNPRNPKGITLAAFLNLITHRKWYQFKKWKPKKIIFFDNELKHLLSVQGALATYYPKIKFTGFHHTLVESEVQPICNLDYKVAQFQIKYFQQIGEWAPDDQASQLIHFFEIKEEEMSDESEEFF